MKDILLAATAYNLWANKRLANVLRTLTSEQLQQTGTGSFPTIEKTMEHLWFAENIWLQRLQLAEQIIDPRETASLLFEENLNAWLSCSADLHAWVKTLQDEQGCTHVFHYRTIKGDLCKSKVWECIQHVMNHGSFHRGQLVNKLREVGITTIPATDFIVYSRE